MRSQYAELVAFGVGEDDKALLAGLADVGARRAECDETFDLLIRIVRLQVRMAPVLAGLALGDWLQPHRRQVILAVVGGHEMDRGPLVGNTSVAKSLGPECRHPLCVDDIESELG